MFKFKLNYVAALVVFLSGVAAVPGRALAVTPGIYFNGLSATLSGSANGSYSISIGDNTVSNVSDAYAVAMGYGNTASGIGSVAFGYGNGTDVYSCVYGATGDGSFVAGGILSVDGSGVTFKPNTASGNSSVAIGLGNTASNIVSVAMGAGNTASGEASVAMGLMSVASGEESFAMGFYSTANGNYSVAMGESNFANGNNSVAMGCESTAKGNYSVAIGLNNYASGNESVAMGNSSKAEGSNSVALGGGTAAVDNSFAFGGTVASGHTASVALGYGSVTGGAYEVSVGSSSQTRKITNVTSAGDLSASNTNAATGADVYNAILGVNTSLSAATTLTNSGNYYAANDNVVTAMGKVDGQVKTNAGNITTLQSYFTDGKANEAIKSTQDGNGNVITTTYATKSEVTAATGDVLTYITSEGLNANNKVLTKVAAGSIAENSTEAVNGGQLYTTNQNVSANADAITKLNGADTLEGSVAYSIKTAFDSKVGTIASGTSYSYIATDKTVSQNLITLDTQVKANADAITTLNGDENTDGSVAKKIATALTGGSTSIIATDITASTYKVGTETYISSSGINANSKQITNVASAGTLSASNTNAATGADVYNAIQGVNTSLSAATTLTTAGNYYAANDSVTTAMGKVDTQVKVNTEAITSVSGKVTALETATAGLDAAKVTQITTNATAIATLNGDASTAGSVANTAKTYSANYSAVSVNGSANINTGSGVELKAGDNIKLTTNGNQVTITSLGGADATAVHYDTDTEGNKTGSVTFYDKDGKTEETGGSVVTLKNAVLEINKDVAGGTTTVVNNTGISVTNATTNVSTIINENGIFTGEDGVKYVKGEDSVSTSLVVIDKQITMIDASKENVDFTTESAKASGEQSTAVGYNTVVEESGVGSTAIGYGNSVSGEQSTVVGYGNTVSGSNSGAFGDPNVVSGSGSYAFGNDNTVSGNGSYVIGNENTVSGNNTFVMGNNVTTSANNSIVLGDGSTATEDYVVSVGSETNQRKIVNVAPGTNATDAVNYQQHIELASRMEQRFRDVNDDIGRTGAAAAALAALHPQMMRKGESQVMAGLGRYHGKSGAAVGLAWQPHQKVMVSGGFADAAGEIMFNVGASYLFGTRAYTQQEIEELNNGKGTPLYAAELTAELKSKDYQIKNLKADSEAMKAKVEKIDAMSEELAQLKAMVAQLMKAKK